MDLASVAGIVLSIGCILLGGVVDGSAPAPGVRAVVFVCGATLGALLLQFPFATLGGALSGLLTAFTKLERDLANRMGAIVRLERSARRNGMRALRDAQPEQSDPFFAKLLSLVIGGVGADLLSETMETDIENERAQSSQQAGVWRSAGLYAPLFGILGAVFAAARILGHPDDPISLGYWSAVAFHSLILGLMGGCAICLPLAGNLSAKGEQVARLKRLTLKGVMFIQEIVTPTDARKPDASPVREPSEGAGEGEDPVEVLANARSRSIEMALSEIKNSHRSLTANMESVGRDLAMALRRLDRIERHSALEIHRGAVSAPPSRNAPPLSRVVGGGATTQRH